MKYTIKYKNQNMLFTELEVEQIENDIDSLRLPNIVAQAIKMDLTQEINL